MGTSPFLLGAPVKPPILCTRAGGKFSVREGRANPELKHKQKCYSKKYSDYFFKVCGKKSITSLLQDYNEPNVP